MGFLDQFKPKEIVAAKIVGVRTAEDTKVLSTWNYGVYSFLVMYEDGTLNVLESKPGDKNWQTLMDVIKFDEA